MGCHLPPNTFNSVTSWVPHRNPEGAAGHTSSSPFKEEAQRGKHITLGS